MTAHIFNLDPEGDDEDRLIVDVAYQMNDGNYWEVWHSRYIDNDPIETSNFSSFTKKYDAHLSDDDNYNYTRPDIVFDAAYDDAGEDRIHAVWQKDTGNDPEYSAIEYSRAILGDYDDWDDDVWGSVYQLDGNNLLDEEPRIDVGQDDSEYIQLAGGGTVISTYYVGVVWHTGKYENSKWTFNVQYAQFYATGTPSVHLDTLTSAAGDDYFGYPYIDIDPVENDSRTTLIGWVYAHWRAGVGWDIVKIQVTTTYMLEDSQNPVDLFDDVDYRNGFPELALQVDHYEGMFFFENTAYFVWLNDEWAQPPDPPYPVEIYAGDVEYTTSGAISLNDSNAVNISYGTSDWDAWNNSFNYGPAVAIFDEEIGKCIWTAKTGISGTAPSVLGDHSDN